jgi:subtilisin family serine protease
MKLFFLLLIFSITFVGKIKSQSLISKISPDLEKKLINSSNNEKIKVWIYFTDKGGNLEKFYNEPLKVVSEKSIKRRQKLNKESILDFSDLPVNNDYVEQVVSNGFNIKHKSKWFNAISGFATKEQINKILRFSFVNRVDLVKGFSKSKNDMEFNETPIIENRFVQPEKLFSLNYGNSFMQNNLINVPAVHNLGYDGSGITICVMDAGFNNLAHTVFDSMNIIATWDFVNGDPNVGDEGDMGNGSHGTYVLSVLGGYAPGNLIGPAYRSNYILAKTENTDSETPVEEDNWVAALEWADSIGVDITSTSLGYLEYDPPYTSYTWQNMDGNTAIITIAGDLAVKKGIIVVNSAGNEGWRSTPNSLIAPADGDSIFAIGAVNSSGLRTSFSSFGPTVDGRIKPDFMAMGSGVVSARASNQTQYTFVSGTSFSCPLVSGAIALLLQANPNLNPIQIRGILRQTSSRSNNPDNFYGWGIINTLLALNVILKVDNSFIPDDFILYQNYPNPFNPSTTINWHSPVGSWITIKLYDVLGREIETIVDGYYDAGNHSTLYIINSTLPSGVYFYQLKVVDNSTGNVVYKDTKKMMLMK